MKFSRRNCLMEIAGYRALYLVSWDMLPVLHLSERYNVVHTFIHVLT